MNWVAVVPLKQGGSQKSRLAQMLDPAQRAALTDALFSHVVTTLGACTRLSKVIVLSPSDPEHAHTEWAPDRGRGLNEELTALRTHFPDRDFLVVHADLPFLEPGDINRLLDAAESGAAIAPDKHVQGTNALAVRAGVSLAFGFGEASFEKHRAVAPAAVIVQSPGLAQDIDTPDDLQAALKLGFALAPS